MPPIVSATAAPTSSGPSVLKKAASTIACAGVAPRVATSVAIAFDASWTPFVNAKAKTKHQRDRERGAHRAARRRCTQRRSSSAPHTMNGNGATKSSAPRPSGAVPNTLCSGGSVDDARR